MKKITIAIDGFSSTGKSTLAKQLAAKLGYVYVDTGAMYRAAALHFLNENLSPLDSEDVFEGLKSLHISFQFNPVSQLQETYLNGVNVEKEIRSMRVAERVSGCVID